MKKSQTTATRSFTLVYLCTLLLVLPSCNSNKDISENLLPVEISYDQQVHPDPELVSLKYTFAYDELDRVKDIETKTEYKKYTVDYKHTINYDDKGITTGYSTQWKTTSDDSERNNTGIASCTFDYSMTDTIVINEEFMLVNSSNDTINEHSKPVYLATGKEGRYIADNQEYEYDKKGNLTKTVEVIQRADQADDICTKVYEYDSDKKSFLKNVNLAEWLIYRLCRFNHHKGENNPTAYSAEYEISDDESFTYTSSYDNEDFPNNKSYPSRITETRNSDGKVYSTIMVRYITMNSPK